MTYDPANQFPAGYLSHGGIVLGLIRDSKCLECKAPISGPRTKVRCDSCQTKHAAAKARAREFNNRKRKPTKSLAEVAIEAYKKWGSVGGKTSAANMTPEQRTERARKAGAASYSIIKGKNANHPQG